MVMYTDGSKKDGKLGVGVCRLNRDGWMEWGRAYGMGSEMEIMDAEMVGIRKAIWKGMEECRKKKVKELVIRVDSQEAMRRVKKREEGPGEMMAYRIRWMIDAAIKDGITVSFEWVKAHANIAGNENADILAKRGCEKPKDNESFISLAYLKGYAKSKMFETWQADWQTDPRKGKNYQGSPNKRNLVRIEDHKRQEQVILSRLRTEHIWVNKYAKRVQKSETDQCECGKGIQSVEHVLMDCAFTVDSREISRIECGLWNRMGLRMCRGCIRVIVWCLCCSLVFGCTR